MRRISHFSLRLEGGRRGGSRLVFVTRALRSLLRLIFFVSLSIAPSSAAHAHAAARGFILLMPTDLYIAGGAAIVALTFVVMAVIPATGLRTLEQSRLNLGELPGWNPLGPSTVTLLIMLILIAAGHLGSRDPLSNPLPLMLWTIWWVGLTFLQALFGNIWAFIHPWRALHRLLTAVPPWRGWRETPPLEFPSRAGYWPAVVLFLAFAWFELVHPAPQDPAVLANAVILYVAVTSAGLLLFGESAWLQHGEIFSIFFRIVSWLAPFGPHDAAEQTADQTGGRRTLSVAPPGQRLLDVGVLPLSGIVFILLALSSVSFDGFSRTFFWLDLIGENPLESPGRTALIGINSLGLLGVFGCLICLFGAAVYAGHMLARSGEPIGKQLGSLVVSIVPIAFGYHFAHYLPELLLDSQFTWRALSDPFGLGWNLIGSRDMHIHASILTNRTSIETIWTIQAFAIVLAHVVAVAIAHSLALRLYGDSRSAILSQIPMAALMITYTMFGLWLLSTPAAG